jgi:hypothetical protein
MNTFDKNWASRMTQILNGLNRSDSYYFQSLFDPTQTHAMYGLTKDTLPAFKEKLKKLGANRFRTVSTKFGFKILCFSAKKIAL